MKKGVALSITLALVMLTSCSSSEDNKNEVNTIYNEQMEYSIDKSTYMIDFQTYLNAMYNCTPEEVKELNTISNGLKSEISVSNSMQTTDDDEISDQPNLTDETEDFEDETVEYPIFDAYGYVVGYGTKEESDESYAIYEATPYYTVNSIESYYDTMLFKVYNKGEMTTKLYECKLNEQGQIESYQILTPRG